MNDIELFIFWLIMSISIIIALYNWTSTKRFKEINRVLFEFSEGQEYYFDKLNKKILELENEISKLKKSLKSKERKND